MRGVVARGQDQPTGSELEHELSLGPYARLSLAAVSYIKDDNCAQDQAEHCTRVAKSAAEQANDYTN